MSFKKIIKSRIAGNIFFLLIFSLTIFYYGLNKLIFAPPQSVHVWRQTNSVSLAQNYYEDNLPLFKPEMHNQFCDGGGSGRSVGEFPLIYYTVAQLWKVFGNNIGVFRLFQLLIQFLGLLALFHGLNFLIKNKFWSAFISLLLFTSPMVVFYGSNFLPDVPSLSFIFIAWFFLLIYLKTRKQVVLWIAATMFCLAMLLKITSALSFISLGGWVLFELIFQKKEQRIFKFQFKEMLPFLVAVILVLFWYVYVDYYNKIHGGHFSYHGIWPVWDMTKEQFLRIIDALDKIYFKELFMPYTQWITIGVWLLLLVFIKKFSPILRFFLIVLPIGFLIQMLLWFQVLEGHDYYTINLLAVFVMVWAFLFVLLKDKRIINHPVLYVLGIAFFLLNVNTCKKRIEDRHKGWMNDMYKNKMEALTEIEPYFQKLKIDKDDKVISLPDYTINASLYYMKRKGYTEFGSDFSKQETFLKRIEQGAKYLIVNDSTMLSQEVLQPFIQNKIGEYKNVLIFDIRGCK